ncbi:MAG: flippase-like domain-containing protein [Deltaproteobacteria bacterium]|nr:flippase-like domain-containing protein [Deltaproteobacteria bacterium]
MRRWNLLFLAIGMAALCGMVAHIGATMLTQGLLRVGWGFLALCALHFSAIALDACNLRFCAGESGARVPALQFIRANLAGHAINSATPFGQLGELTKYSLLSEHVPEEDAAATMVLSNLVRLVATCLLLGIGQPLVTLVLGLESSVSTLIHASSALFLVIAMGTVVVVRGGVGRLPFELAKRLGIPSDQVERARAFWSRVESLARRGARNRRQMVYAGAMVACSAACDLAEVTVILWLLGVEHGPSVALLAMGNAQIVSWLTGFVPLGAGTAEAGAYVFFRALGLPPNIGVLLELVKKVRRVVFVGLGVVVLGNQAFRQHLGGRIPAPEPAVAPSPDYSPVDRA